MEKHLKHIDNLFKEGLGSYAETPPPDIWSALEERLDNNDNKKPGYFYRRRWFFIILAFLSMFSSLMAWKFNNGAMPLANDVPQTGNVIAKPAETQANTDRNLPSATPGTFAQKDNKHAHTAIHTRKYNYGNQVTTQTESNLAATNNEPNNANVNNQLTQKSNVTAPQPAKEDHYAMASNNVDAPASETTPTEPAKSQVIKYIIKKSVKNNIEIAESTPVAVAVNNNNSGDDDEDEVTFGKKSNSSSSATTQQYTYGSRSHITTVSEQPSNQYASGNNITHTPAGTSAKKGNTTSSSEQATEKNMAGIAAINSTGKNNPAGNKTDAASTPVKNNIKNNDQGIASVNTGVAAKKVPGNKTTNTTKDNIISNVAKNDQHTSSGNPETKTAPTASPAVAMAAAKKTTAKKHIHHAAATESTKMLANGQRIQKGNRHTADNQIGNKTGSAGLSIKSTGKNNATPSSKTGSKSTPIKTSTPAGSDIAATTNNSVRLPKTKKPIQNAQTTALAGTMASSVVARKGASHTGKHFSGTNTSVAKTENNTANNSNITNLSASSSIGKNSISTDRTQRSVKTMASAKVKKTAMLATVNNNKAASIKVTDAHSTTPISGTVASAQQTMTKKHKQSKSPIAAGNTTSPTHTGSANDNDLNNHPANAQSLTLTSAPTTAKSYSKTARIVNGTVSGKNTSRTHNKQLAAATNTYAASNGSTGIRHVKNVKTSGANNLALASNTGQKTGHSKTKKQSANAPATASKKQRSNRSTALVATTSSATIATQPFAFTVAAPEKEPMPLVMAAAAPKIYGTFKSDSAPSMAPHPADSAAVAGVNKMDSSSIGHHMNLHGFVYGIKAGYEEGFNTGAAHKMVFSPYAEKGIGGAFSILFQPAIKSSSIAERSLSGNQIFYGTDKGSITPDGAFYIPINTSINGTITYDTIIRRNYIYTQSHDSIVKSYSIGGTYMEFELPIMLKYKLNKRLSCYGGVTIDYSKFIPVHENTYTGPEIPVSVLDFTLGNMNAPIPTIKSIAQEIKYKGTPISGYLGPLYPSQQGNLTRIGLMFGFSYELNKRYLIDALFQQASVKPYMEGGIDVNKALSSGYYRFTLGYKLFR